MMEDISGVKVKLELDVPVENDEVTPDHEDINIKQEVDENITDELYCSESFLQNDEANKEPPKPKKPGMAMKVSKETFNCSECSYKSLTRRGFLTHFEKVHMQVNIFVCEYCRDSFASSVKRNGHLEDAHFQCSQCDFQAEEPGDMSYHRNAVHQKKKTHPCTHPNCQKVFPTVDCLDDHIREAHSVPEKTSYDCKQCDFTCVMSYDFYEHMSSVHHQEIFDCDKCDFKSHLAWQMADHDGSHNIKGYACNECNYTTTRIMFLRRHHKSRHTEKTEKCPICPFRSAQKWCVTQHVMQVHEKTRLYPCEECNYKATSRGNLNVHIRGVHIRDKKYECNRCGFKTSLKTGLIKHMKSHAENLQLSCELCSYTADSKSAMMMHKKKYHSMKCSYCDFTTQSVGILQTHVRYHKIESQTFAEPQIVISHQ